MNAIEYNFRLLEIFILTFCPKKWQQKFDWSFIKKMTDTQFCDMLTSHWYQSVPRIVRQTVRRTLHRRGYNNCTFDRALARYLVDHRSGCVAYLYNEAKSKREIMLVLQHVMHLENYMTISLVKKLFEILQEESFLDVDARFLLIRKSRNSPYLKDEYQATLKEHQRIADSEIDAYSWNQDFF